ncbi:MAG: hypothetical protein H6825_01545 [Planctomycetes bacterium]|nr:hypothetical protein [Planctomycetota bacterium]
MLTSETMATLVTVLTLAVATALVGTAWRRRRRRVLPLVACLVWTLFLVRLHQGLRHDTPVDVYVTMLLAPILAVASLVAWPADWKARGVMAASVLLLGGVVGFVTQLVLFTTLSSFAPWTNGREGKAVLHVENGSLVEVRARWILEHGDELAQNAAWLVAAPGDVAHATIRGRPRFDRHPDPAWEGTLHVRLGDGVPTNARVVVPPEAHLAVHVDAARNVTVSVGRQGCFGAPRLGEEHPFAEVAADAGLFDPRTRDAGRPVSAREGTR